MKIKEELEYYNNKNNIFLEKYEKRKKNSNINLKNKSEKINFKD
jgi:hypothetical protein